ncbi:MAG: hypothetical protein IJ716_01445 [Lachnospiraceae bacterium]|nr:hypothetical protein [Lachnospiraceae bacterium]
MKKREMNALIIFFSMVSIMIFLIRKSTRNYREKDNIVVPDNIEDEYDDFFDALDDEEDMG